MSTRITSALALCAALAAVALAAGCRGPGEERGRARLKLNAKLLKVDWSESPRKEAVAAEIQREVRRFVQRIFMGEPMPVETPEEQLHAASLRQTLRDIAAGGKRLARVARPPEWSDGRARPERDLENDLPKAWSIVVRQGERLGQLARWAGTDSATIVSDNREVLGRRKWLRVGDRLMLTMSPNQKYAFDEAREKHGEDRIQSYFAKRYVSKVIVYKVKKGELVANAAKRYGEVPLWLLQEFNQTDFRSLRRGDEILIPVVETYSSTRGLPGGLRVLDEDENPLTEQKRQVVEGKLRTDLLGRARLAIDDSNVFERGARGLAGSDSPLLPDYGKLTAPPQVKKTAAAERATRTVREVIVKRGETLSHYVAWSGLSIGRIKSANPGLDPNVIQVGAHIKLPLTDAAYATFVTARQGGERPQLAHAAPPKPVQVVGSASAGATKPVAAELKPVAAVIPANQPPKPPARSKLTTPKTKPYVVRAGETATVIARKKGTNLKVLRQLNPKTNLDRLKIGQILYLPREG